jgi:biotin carboxyl carrier protein
MEYRYQVGARIVRVRIERAGDGWRASIDSGAWHTVQIASRAPNSIELDFDGKRSRISVERSGNRRFVARGSDVFEFERVERDSRQGKRLDGSSTGTLEATMPGQVVAVAIKEGDRVERGQTLVVLEAMKMELRVTAPQPSRVAHVLVRVGEVVERGQRLLELEA